MRISDYAAIILGLALVATAYFQTYPGHQFIVAFADGVMVFPAMRFALLAFRLLKQRA